jgi:NAD+ kinase
MANHNQSLKIKKVGFVVKHHQPEANKLALEMADHAQTRNCQILFADESKAVAKGFLQNLKSRKNQSQVHIVEKSDLVKNSDLIVVLGGDGTFLSVARLMGTRSVPILGVNMGQLGFLTEIRKEEAIETLEATIRGTPPFIQERAMLEVILQRAGKTIFQGPVINDAVISKGAIARIIGMQVWVDKQWVHLVRADGMIVSTTTGSTAYALAAGGPIVTPNVPAMVMAPICPHSLTLRPIVIPETSEIKICLSHRPGHVLLTLDGQDAIDMKEDDIVLIHRFKKHSLKLISSPSRDYFSILREKLKFGARD